MLEKKCRVALLGTGLIGMDLLVKIRKSPLLECALAAGRNSSSAGMQFARNLGVPVTDGGIDALLENADDFDVVFDATSAADHILHWERLKKASKKVIDLTPSHVGHMIVPAINLDDCLLHDNLNLVSCAGQASIPLVAAITRLHDSLRYVEVSCAAASKSVGPATRRNLDEFIETTQDAVLEFSDSGQAKVMVTLSPANPCIDYQVSLSARIGDHDIEQLTRSLEDMARTMRQYVPGYQLNSVTRMEEDRILVLLKVQGQGDYLPEYAGNLDIITCAAIAVAERIAVGEKNSVSSMSAMNA